MAEAVESCWTVECGRRADRQLRLMVPVAAPSGRAWMPLKWCVCQVCCDALGDQEVWRLTHPGAD